MDFVFGVPAALFSEPELQFKSCTNLLATTNSLEKPRTVWKPTAVSERWVKKNCSIFEKIC